MDLGDPFHHVRDGVVWELPRFIHDALGRTEHFVLPFGLTKYMVLQLVAFALVYLIFRGLAKRIADGKPAKGMWWNFWEMLAVFIRDEVVRPAIGIPHHHDDHGHGHDGHAHGGHGEHHAEPAHAHAVAADTHSHASPAHAVAAVEVGHPADKYLPYVWSVFFYILFCNLLGAIPFLGSPTANINVTGVLAFVTFVYVAFYGSERGGFGDFLKSLVPHMELPGPIAVVLLPMIWAIEAFGFLIKHTVLAIRLFANIMAGHTVLGVFLGFIALMSGTTLWGVVVPASIFGQVGIGMLELFVAFLQAYVFAMLTSLFISAAVNPH